MTVIKSLVELAQAVEDSKEIEWLCEGQWKLISYTGINLGGALYNINDGRFRIKPKPIKIDLSFLVGSGVDCQFAVENQAFEIIGLLAGFDPLTGKYLCLNQGAFDECMPRMNHWMSPENCADLSIHRTLENAGFEVVLAAICGNYEPVASFMITGVRKGYTL